MAEALLFGGDDRVGQIQAAREIATLSTKQKKKLADNGVIPPLVVMLHGQDYESIEAALFALLHLAFGSERNKLLIAKAGAVPGIVKVLQWRNESLSELAVAALMALSSCSGNRAEIASSGAVRLLLKMMGSGRVSQRASLDVISTLHSLSASKQGLPVVVDSGGLITVAQLIYQSDKSSNLVERAMALLESFISSSQVALSQACETNGVIGMLVEAVEEGTAACQEHAMGVLLTICETCRENYRGKILREGAMAGLLQLSVNGTSVARKKANALLFLLRDGDEGGSKARHKKNVALEKVMREIDREEWDNGTSSQVVEEMIAKLRT